MTEAMLPGICYLGSRWRGQERLPGDGSVASLSLRYSLVVGEVYGSNPCTKRIKNGHGEGV